MRVLLDENLAHDLVGVLTGHAVSTVQGQQNLTSLSFGVVVIDAPSNRMADLLPVVPELLHALEAVRPGDIRHVGTSPTRRRGTGQGPARPHR